MEAEWNPRAAECDRCEAHWKGKEHEYPWCVDKVERATGDVYFRWRRKTREQAERVLRAVLDDPKQDQERFTFLLYEEDFTIPF